MSERHPQDDELHRLVMSHVGDRYKIETGHRCSTSQTGEEYKVFCLAMFDMNELARTMALVLMDEGSANDTLYWRVTPGCEHQGDWGWKAYMRFLVSSKASRYATERDNPDFANSYHGRAMKEMGDKPKDDVAAAIGALEAM